MSFDKSEEKRMANMGSPKTIIAEPTKSYSCNESKPPAIPAPKMGAYLGAPPVGGSKKP